MQRPPYLRWGAAACLVASAFAWDASGRRTEPYPVAAADIERGSPIDDASVRWVDLPVGVLTAPDLTGAVAARLIAAGEPIALGALETASPVPAGWWSVAVPLPDTAVPGTSVRLVIVDPPASADGIVVAAPASDPFASARDGLVAVPADVAASVAVAAAEGLVVTLLSP